MPVSDSPLIHIGYSKCASTSLQRGFFKACNDLSYLGVQMDFADGGEDAHRAVYSIASLGICEYEQRKDEIRSSIQDFLEGKDSVVISNEVLSSGSHTPFQRQGWCDTVTVAERLKAIFPNAKILIIIRNQLDILPSIYAEISKPSTVSVRWNDYISTAIGADIQGRGSLLHRLNYFNTYSVYADMFGHNNVKVAMVEDLTRDPETFLRDICELACPGKNIPVTEFSLKKENVRLTSLDKAKKRLGSMLPGLSGFISSITQKNSTENPGSRFGSRPASYSAEQTEYLRKFYRQGNRALSESTGLKLEEAGYP
ncbi:hypothetical protein E4634_17400 [Mangrovimicrobium sediminis]|uniref:Sulfotransferase domain-containing protein n=1 Tax=Mangrovimicrobium sediminis TaxID=2562682 RepID=A0A4Z0LXJ3_9GAMM|nr:hypothetical protein [Haliea sp. SAOS-164]TGD71886.1 hypothetical protein E4634_17400 [Haliea sp. SAOS-164]